ncbi:uncharacterized protein PAC_13270 [Phialocephala subalpina]|uniref:Uncharacterized protein n=1 Tax=Phialocephala subalpina TaxID=576137 RepID=A0A1L7XEC5_9HELO|nr:uncharacterized protein PAC_13270 [Phialocephala subalpina]
MYNFSVLSLNRGPINELHKATLFRTQIVAATITMSSHEPESTTCTALPIEPKVEAEVPEADEQTGKPKASYETTPVEIKEMIIKCSLCDWDPASQKMPACVRGLRGNAEEIFYKTCTFDLRDIQIKQLVKMPHHVFGQIQHVAINFRTDFTERISTAPTKLELRTLQIYQGIRPTWLEAGLWVDCKWIIGSFEFLEGSANPAKDFVTRKKFVAVGVPRISTQLGIEGEGPEDKESRDDLTWVWKAADGSFLTWSPHYNILE